MADVPHSPQMCQMPAIANRTELYRMLGRGDGRPRAARFPGLLAGLQALAAKGQAVVYNTVHMILGEGNFVLVVAEATFGSVPTAIYDLFRIEDGKIAEHWDTLETIPPRADWKNENGKF